MATDGSSSMKLIQDNPSSMFQIIQEFLTAHNRPVFVVIERADILFKKLPDCALYIAQHNKYLSSSKLCVIFESRESIQNIRRGFFFPYHFNHFFLMLDEKLYAKVF